MARGFFAPEPAEKAVVAALDLSPEPGDVEGNLRMAEEAILEAKEAEPALRWAVLPELVTSGYSDLASVPLHAEDAEAGRSARRMRALASDLGVYVAYGFPELRACGVSDSANLVGPEGVVLTYRKRHLVRTTMEPGVFVPGTELPVLEAGGVRVAFVICWDLGFPELVREAALDGAELVLAPAGWRDPWGPQYDLACAARALDNAVYVASANQSGVYPEATFNAPGAVYGPDGRRVSGRVGNRSAARFEPGHGERWREYYGSTVDVGLISPRPSAVEAPV